MREIKFRAWSIIGKRMYDWEQMHASPTHKLSQYFRYHDMYNIMQFTGLKDKNGKEVYEGDIIKTDEAGWKAQVVYRREGFMLIGLDGKGFSVEPNWELCEVIGNIYENPELLKENKT